MHFVVAGVANIDIPRRLDLVPQLSSYNILPNETVSGSTVQHNNIDLRVAACKSKIFIYQIPVGIDLYGFPMSLATYPFS